MVWVLPRSVYTFLMTAFGWRDARSFFSFHFYRSTTCLEELTNGSGKADSFLAGENGKIIGPLWLGFPIVFADLNVRFSRFVQNLNIALENEESMFHLSTPNLTCYTLSAVEMSHSSNAIIHGSTFNSAQDNIHVYKTDSGMHDFSSVQKSTLIDDPMKDFIPWDY